jgi:tetratricopeptide (TPR) repeat protein
MRRYRWEILIILLLVICTGAVFSRSLRAEFVQWDDDTLIYQNPYLTGLNPATVKWAFTAFDYVVRYQPLTWLSWAAICQVFGRDPFGYHLAGLAFHALNTCLLFLLLRRILCLAHAEDDRAETAKWVLLCAGAGALLWAIHPLRVETVAWASAFLHGQAIFFLLLSGWAYLEARAAAPQTKRRACFYWASVFGFLFSLFSYPIGLGFVVALLALDCYPLRRFRAGRGAWWNSNARALYLEKLPFVAVAGLCVGITVWARLNVTGGWLEAAPLSEFGLMHRAMQAVYVWAYYVWKTWWPFNLAPVYTTLLNFRPMDSAFVQSLVLLVLISAILISQRRAWPAALPLWISYLALMVPVLGLTEHPHYPNDRYSNLPGILTSIALAAALLQWCRTPKGRALALAGCLATAGLLGALSVRQVGIWQSSHTLLRYQLARLGNDPYRFDIHWRLGRVLADQGNLDEAMTHYLASLSIVPEFAEAHYSLGVALERSGKIDDALQQYSTTLRLKPAYAEAHVRLGFILADRGLKAEAIGHLQQALRVDPKLIEARRKLAELEPAQ